MTLGRGDALDPDPRLAGGMSNPGAPRALLAEAFAGVDPRIPHYILTGGGGDLASSLLPADRAAVASIDPSARGAFYCAMDQLDRADDAVLVRLGRLLAVASDRGPWAPKGVPASVWALLRDATFSVFGTGRHQLPFTTISIERIGALLAMEGVGADDIDGLIVDMMIGASRSSLGYGPRGLQTVPGTAVWAAARGEVVQERAKHFPLDGHRELARLASTCPPLAIAVAPALLSQILDGSGEERALALAAAEAIPSDVRIEVLEAMIDAVPSAQRGRLIGAVERIPDTEGAVLLLERAHGRARGAARAEYARAIRRLRIFQHVQPESPAPSLVPLAERRLEPEAVECMRVALTHLRDRLIGSLPALRAQRDEFERVHQQRGSNEVEYVERDISRVEDTLAALPDVVSTSADPLPTLERRSSTRSSTSPW